MNPLNTAENIESTAESTAESMDDIMSSIRRIIEQDNSPIDNSSLISKVEAHLGSGRSDELTKTLERLMTPLLHSWLAENLPSIVERIVREEVQLISRNISSTTTPPE